MHIRKAPNTTPKTVTKAAATPGDTKSLGDLSKKFIAAPSPCTKRAAAYEPEVLVTVCGSWSLASCQCAAICVSKVKHLLCGPFSQTLFAMVYVGLHVVEETYDMVPQ